MYTSKSLNLALRETINHLRTSIVIRIRKVSKDISNKKLNSDHRFSHVTAYSSSNAGDTALSSCVRKLFDTSFGKISWHLCRLTGEVTTETIKDFNNSDAVIIGGHGAFLPDTNANEISGWEFACSIQQYEEILKPIIVFGVGYNYFKGQERTQLFEENINYLVRKSIFFGLRNSGSVKEIQSFIDEDIRNKVVFQPCPTTIIRYLYPNLSSKKETHKVAFNVALDRSDKRMGESAEIILNEIAKSMYEIYKKGYEIHFITHVNKEIAFMEYINQYQFKYIFHSASSWDIKHLMNFYNEMDVVISMRGHALWIPFGVNCHIISLGNQNKTKWFLEDIDAEDWYINIMNQPNQLSREIVDKFVDIHELNGLTTTRRLLEAQEKLWNITQNNMKEISGILSVSQNNKV